MAAGSTTRPTRLRTGGGQRGPVDNWNFGGGGGGGGGRGDDIPEYAERLRRYRLGLALAVVAIVLLFAGVSSLLFARDQLGTWDPASGTYVRNWQPVRLPVGLLAFNTILLAVSSITMELARRQEAERALLAPLLNIPGISAGSRPKPWLLVSGFLGFGFLSGQLLAWRNLLVRGLDISSVPATSGFYLLTSVHALHLTGGLVAMIYAGATTALFHKTQETRRIAVDVTAWYWHVMAVLWLGIFGLLLLYP